MAIHFSCPCGRSLTLKDEHAGRRIQCPDCGDALRVPEKTSSDQSSGRTSARSSSGREMTRAEKRAAARRQNKPTTKPREESPERSPRRKPRSVSKKPTTRSDSAPVAKAKIGKADAAKATSPKKRRAKKKRKPKPKRAASNYDFDEEWKDLPPVQARSLPKRSNKKKKKKDRPAKAKRRSESVDYDDDDDTSWNAGGIIGAVIAGGLAFYFIMFVLKPDHAGRGPGRAVVLAATVGGGIGHFLWRAIVGD